MPDAYAQFGDQRVGYGFSYTLQWGTTPGIASISCPPFSGNFDGVDNLDVFFRGALLFSLRQARFADPSMAFETTSAPVVQRQIEDRRWKWQFGLPLFGSFNEELPSGSLLREQSPRQLAALCFEALGDAVANVDALPTEPRPRIIWDGARPVDELDRLCSQFGCAVGYDPFSDRAFLVKIGIGSAPPNRAQKSRTDGLLIPASPDNVRILMGPTLYQVPIKLTTPVGLDVDGKYHDLDDLSYKPTSIAGLPGWSGLDPKNFDAITSQYADPATGEMLYHRELAKTSVWRAYRFAVTTPAILVGTPDAPQSIKDMGPFPGYRLERDPLTGERMPAMVRGVFADDRPAFQNTTAAHRYPGTVSINNELKIVTFSEPFFRYGANGSGIFPAIAELIAAFNISVDGVPLRQSYSQGTGQAFSSGEYQEHHEEFAREIIEAKASLTGVPLDTLTKVNTEAAYYANALLGRFAEQPAASVAYNGLSQFTLDGTLRSIQWTLSTTGAPTTTVSWNAETNRFVLPYEQRAAARAQRQLDYANRRAAQQSAVIQSRAAVARSATS